MARPRLSHPTFVSTLKLLSHGPSPYPYVWVISCFFVLFNFKGSQILVRVKYSVISWIHILHLVLLTSRPFACHCPENK